MLPPDPRQMSVNKLVARVTSLFTPSTADLETQSAFDEAGLFPTQKTAYLMAQAAVTVLLAHDIGQNVTAPLKTVDHAAAPAQLPPPAEQGKMPAAGAGDLAPAKLRHRRAAKSARKAAPRRAAGKANGAGATSTPAPSPSKPRLKCPYCDWTTAQPGRMEPHVKKTHPGQAVPPRE